MGRAAQIIKNRGRFREVGSCIRHFRNWQPLMYAYLAGRCPDPGLTLYPRLGGTIQADDFFDLTTVWACWCGTDYKIEPTMKRIVDLGANIGVFTFLATTAAPDAQVVAVEPHPATFDRLMRLITANNLGDRVLPLQYAVAGSDGSRSLSPGGWGSTSSRLNPVGQNDGDGTQVRCMTLSELVRRACNYFGHGRIDLLKIDIEGGEFEVFRDEEAMTSLEVVDAIQIEYHDQSDATKHTLFQALDQTGFKLRSDEVRGNRIGIAHFQRQENGPSHV